MTDWTAEARRILTEPAPDGIVQTELRMQRLQIILAELVKGQGK